MNPLSRYVTPPIYCIVELPHWILVLSLVSTWARTSITMSLRKGQDEKRNIIRFFFYFYNKDKSVLDAKKERTSELKISYPWRIDEFKYRWKNFQSHRYLDDVFVRTCPILIKQQCLVHRLWTQANYYIHEKNLCRTWFVLGVRISIFDTCELGLRDIWHSTKHIPT